MMFAHFILNIKMKSQMRSPFKSIVCVTYSIQMPSLPWQGHVAVYIFITAIVSAATGSECNLILRA